MKLLKFAHNIASLLLLLTISAGASAQMAPPSRPIKQHLEKRVPIIIYDSSNIDSALSEAFEYGANANFYTITPDQIYLHRAGEDTGLGRAIDGFPAEFATFRPIILGQEGCFFLALNPEVAFDNKYLGIKDGDNYRFIDSEKQSYSSLNDLLLAINGYNSHKITSNDEALDILRANYNYTYIVDEDSRDCISSFVKHVANVVDINWFGRLRLKSKLRQYCASQPDIEPCEEWSDYCASGDANYTPLMGYNVFSVLESRFTPAEMELIMGEVTAERKMGMIAFEHMARQWRKEFFKKRGLVITGFDEVHYPEIFEYINARLECSK